MLPLIRQPASGGGSDDARRFPRRHSHGLTNCPRHMPRPAARALSSLPHPPRRPANSIAHWFRRLYANLGFDGCSSHSGRRTAITTWARNVSKVSGSMRDVQSLAGHSSMQINQAYIDVNVEAKQKLVDLV